MTRNSDRKVTVRTPLGPREGSGSLSTPDDLTLGRCLNPQNTRNRYTEIVLYKALSTASNSYYTSSCYTSSYKVLYSSKLLASS